MHLQIVALLTQLILHVNTDSAVVGLLLVKVLSCNEKCSLEFVFSNHKCRR